MAILYCGRNLIWRQCSSCRSGVTWSYLDFLRTSFAELIWTLCKRTLHHTHSHSFVHLLTESSYCSSPLMPHLSFSLSSWIHQQAMKLRGGAKFRKASLATPVTVSGRLVRTVVLDDCLKCKLQCWESCLFLLLLFEQNTEDAWFTHVSR